MFSPLAKKIYLLKALVFFAILFACLSFVTSAEAKDTPVFWSKDGNTMTILGKDYSVTQRDGNGQASELKGADGKIYARTVALQKDDSTANQQSIFTCKTCENKDSIAFNIQSDGSYRATLTSGEAGLKEAKVAAVDTAKKAAEEEKKAKSLSCGMNILTSEGWSCIFGRTAYFFLELASLLVYAAGTLLEMVFRVTVLNMSSTVGTIKGVIGDSWKMLRDIINITFIFGLLYAAIGEILQRQEANKKLVVTIVVSAIFVNFSLFFAQIIIDFSNNFTVAIWNSIQGNKTSLASGIMQALHLENNFLTDAAIKAGFWNLAAKAFLTTALISVIAVVFFIIAILLVVRFLVFIILMITSPAAIAGGVFPQLKENIAGKWWKQLADQSMWAPVFFLLFSISLNIMDKIGSIPELRSTGSVDKGGIATTLFSFAVVIGLIIQALVISKQMSASGAEKFQSKFLKYSGADAFQSWSSRLPGRIGTRAVNATGGRIANSLANSSFGQRMGSSRLGSGIYNTLNKAGSGWREQLDKKTKEEIARAELRTRAANSGNQRQLQNSQQAQTDANILLANERIADRQDAEVLHNEVLNDLRAITAGGVNPRDLAHAQEMRTELNETIQGIDRDINNQQATIRSIQAGIQARGAGATADPGEVAALNSAQNQINTLQATRAGHQAELTNLTNTMRPVQEAAQHLERIDGDLQRLYAGYNPQAFQESATAIEQLANNIRRNGHEDVRGLDRAGLEAMVGRNGTLTREIERLRTEIRNTEIHHAQENSTGHITGGMGWGLNQAARRAAADEYRRRYTNRA